MSNLTKYEILKSYIDAGDLYKVRDTWSNLGATLIVAASRTFIKDMVYKIDSGLGLEGSLVLCEASLYSSDPLTWNTAVIEDADNGFLSFAAGIITPHFRLLLDKDQVDSITEPIDPTFVPYTEVTTSTVIITDEELEVILTEAGVPFILMEELEYPRNKICDNMIRPAMQEYYKYFPILDRFLMTNSITTAGQRVELEMPPEAFGVARVMVYQGLPGMGSGGNPMHFFANEIAWWGGGSGSWSPIRYNAGSSPGFANLQGFNTMALDRAARQGIMNYATRQHSHVEKRGDKKILVFHANRAGQAEIIWTKASNDWNDVEFARLPEVRKLATAKVLRALGMLRGQVKPDIPGSINFDNFITRADRLEEEVLEFWKNKPVALALRGSM